MKQDRKKIKREKKRLRAIREMKEQRNKRKRNIDFISPKKRDIEFSDASEKE
ncbi:hypothetical protein ES705_21731 [subsurface metagenome]